MGKIMGEWINVKERMPEKRKWVKIYCRRLDKWWPEFANYQGDGIWRLASGGGMFTKSISRWTEDFKKRRPILYQDEIEKLDEDTRQNDIEFHKALEGVTKTSHPHIPGLWEFKKKSNKTMRNHGLL